MFTLDSQVERARKVIAQAKNICILTGSGISAESGIPTFRDKQTGLWENYRAEDLANINAFRREPHFVWSWYQWRRGLVKDKLPNPAHHAMAKLEAHFYKINKQLNIITQNVDDLHEQAGSTTTHLHGNLWNNRCSDCHKPYTDNIDYHTNYEEIKLFTCDGCGGYIRPDIVWFGEMLPQAEWRFAEVSAITCDVFISIGTSSMVYPAASLAELARQRGATLIEINPTPTDNPIIDIVLAEKAGLVLPILVNAIIKSTQTAEYIS